jgi:LPXTG-motif cell wall-anchored protein
MVASPVAASVAEFGAGPAIGVAAALSALTAALVARRRKRSRG